MNLKGNQSKIRLLFAVDGIEFGGGERLFAQLINRLPVDEYELFVISNDNPDFYQAIDNAKARLIPIDFSARINPGLFLRIAKVIRRNGIQIVNGQGARVEFYARIAARLAGGARYVSTMQMPVEGYNVSSPTRKIYSFFDRRSEKYVDRMIVVSDALKAAVIAGHGFPADRVVKIYNGIEIDFFDPCTAAASGTKIRNEFGVAENRPLVGAVGRMVWQKGFDYLLRCWPEVLRTRPDALLLMAGDGPLRGSFEALARELNLKESVIFAGFRADIRNILAGVDLLAVPSLLEGFPMITLEAMAMQKPIVATDIDGMRDQFIDGESGLLVPPGDTAALAASINRLLNDKALAARVGAAARGRVSREFLIQKTVAKTIKVYRSLAPQPPGGPR